MYILLRKVNKIKELRMGPTFYIYKLRYNNIHINCRTENMYLPQTIKLEAWPGWLPSFSENGNPLDHPKFSCRHGDQIHVNFFYKSESNIYFRLVGLLFTSSLERNPASVKTFINWTPRNLRFPMTSSQKMRWKIFESYTFCPNFRWFEK